MAQTSITAAGVIDTFLVLLIGIGPKLALVPFLEITAPLDPAAKRLVVRRMLVTAATVALVLMALGELLRALLHFTVGALSIAGGVILFVLAVAMVLGQDGGHGHQPEGKTPLELAQFPLAVPYLLNPVGIVGLVTISAELESLGCFRRGGRHPRGGLVDRRSGVPLGEPGRGQAGRRPHAGHREGLRLPHRRHRRPTCPRRPRILRGHCARRALNRGGRGLGCSVREVEDGLDVVGLAGVGVGPSADRRLAGDEPSQPRRVGLGQASAASS